MYIPKAFEVKDEEEILQFVKEHPLGILISSNPKLQACHLPFLLEKNEGQFILEAHLAKENQQALFELDEEALVIFNGPNGYISSSVYVNVNAPTYNYQAVHFGGKLSRMTNQELKNHLEKLVAKQEMGRKKPFSMDQMPAQMLDDYLSEIVGLKVTVGKIEAAFKLSQNRSAHDFQSIVSDLEQSPANHALINAMKKTR